jgi:hypothetical protein
VNPYPYQREVYRQFYIEKKKRIVLVWPRRTGKDTTAINVALPDIIQNPGVYLYAFPELKQAREAVWDNITEEGKTFLDYIPKQLIKRVDKQNFQIFLKPNSIIRLIGADRADSRVGAGARGIIWSEFMLTTQRAYNLLSPMIVKTNGWMIFPFTPRGMQNHAYELYHKNLDNPMFFCDHRTVEQCYDNNGKRIYTDEQMEAERREGKSEEYIRQEYYCDWESANANSIYSNQVREAKTDGRICDYDIPRGSIAYTFWDIGYSHYTSIWIVIPKGPKLLLYGFIQGFGKPGLDYITGQGGLKEFAQKHGIRYAKHYVPSDIKKTNFWLGLSDYQLALQAGYQLEPLPKQRSVLDGIGMAKVMFERFVIHKTNCAEGLSAIGAYHFEWMEKRNHYSKEPVHDWSSHAADALRYIAVGWDDNLTRDDAFKLKVSKVDHYAY